MNIRIIVTHDTDDRNGVSDDLNRAVTDKTTDGLGPKDAEPSTIDVADMTPTKVSIKSLDVLDTAGSSPLSPIHSDCVLRPSRSSEATSLHATPEYVQAPDQRGGDPTTLGEDLDVIMYDAKHIRVGRVESNEVENETTIELEQSERASLDISNTQDTLLLTDSMMDEGTTTDVEKIKLKAKAKARPRRNAVSWTPTQTGAAAPSLFKGSASAPRMTRAQTVRAEADAKSSPALTAKRGRGKKH